MRILMSIVIVLAAVGGCASQGPTPYQQAVTISRPPADFWVAVTVLRSPAGAASRATAYKQLPVGIRPARYVIEADRTLRVAVGSGADETTFPGQTRQLTDQQFTSLWETLRTSSLVKTDNPALVGSGPSPTSIGDQTIYVISFMAAGSRRVLAIEAEPKAGDGAAEARKLVEELAALAWVK